MMSGGKYMANLEQSFENSLTYLVKVVTVITVNEILQNDFIVMEFEKFPPTSQIW